MNEVRGDNETWSVYNGVRECRLVSSIKGVDLVISKRL